MSIRSGESEVYLACLGYGRDAAHDDRVRKRILLDYLWHIGAPPESGLEEKAIRLLRGSRGKPYMEWEPPFADRPPLFYSVSHSRELWVMAVSSSPIGVDVEWKKERTYHREQALFFHPEEQDYLERHPWELSRIWSAKESCVKLLGTGVLADTAAFTVIRDDRMADEVNGQPLAELPFFEGYHSFLCGGGRTCHLARYS